MAFTAEEKHSTEFRDQGWVALRGLLDEGEVSKFKDIVNEAFSSGAFDPKGTGHQSEQSTDEYKHTLRVLRDLSTRYEDVRALAVRLAPIIRDMAGWSGARLWGDRVFLKPGREFGSRPTVWHQDLPRAPFDRRGFATVWIAISDVPMSRGPLTFLTGSHRLGPLGSIGQLGEDRDLSEILREDDWAHVAGCNTAAPLAPGDATVHGGLTLHRAGKNTDEEDRVVVAVEFFDSDALYTGAQSPITDGLGLEPYSPFDHEKFPIMA